MPRRFGLPSVYLAAAMATAATTAVPLAMTPASGKALRPAVTEPSRPYIVTARSRPDARDLVGEVRWRVRRFYTAALPGFATFLTAAELAELRADPRVLTVEADRQLHPIPVRRTPRPTDDWGTGARATVYVVDSGVDVARPEFGDRAWHAFDATGGTGRDCTGHGTQVARIAAGRVTGIAPAARIASVRVLGCAGPGSLSDVIAGLDWIRRHARGPSVANLSIDGADSPALDTAVRGLVQAGVFVVGAADSGICQVTPGGEVFSALAPQVAGAAARHLEHHPEADPSALAASLKCIPAHSAIRQNPSRSSNLLMHNGGL
ncbi:S8 family serine peptidase [Nonomuraea sp. NN258]|uniref:S8 family serine peptidase n=1 Tax=Nonomuraea antri TaxID=2730852 RepID=UPI0015690C11|nr:S8 family serine peptidase [Nonomuraea antri]NRQ38602.1 S8 family serine peptidase [Nonomuraea antri]